MSSCRSKCHFLSVLVRTRQYLILALSVISVLASPQAYSDLGNVQTVHALKSNESYEPAIIKVLDKLKIGDLTAVSYTHLTLPTIYSV